jgi:uncharacterized protein YdeI (YjbR/CyaY-like superfamily)
METATISPIIACESPGKWGQWLAHNHARSDGVWLRIFKKGSGTASLTYAEALDAALCYGWVDGQKKRHDALSWLQKFTPRRSKSLWSKINTQHVRRLIKAGKMRPAGLREVDAAKRDGRWKRAYDSPRTATVPEDFLAELRKNKKANAFFDTLDKRNTYAISFRLQNARTPETREKRIQAILAMMATGEKFHP